MTTLCVGAIRLKGLQIDTCSRTNDKRSHTNDISFSEDASFNLMLKFCDTPLVFSAPPGMPSKNFHRLHHLEAHWCFSLKVNVSKCTGYELDIDIKSACLSHAAFRYGTYCRHLSLRHRMVGQSHWLIVNSIVVVQREPEKRDIFSLFADWLEAKIWI